MKNSYEEIIQLIIARIQTMIGPVAIRQADQVDGLKVNKKISIDGDPIIVLESLIDTYVRIIGPVALTLAKQAIAPIIKKNPKMKIPEKLKELR